MEMHPELYVSICRMGDGEKTQGGYSTHIIVKEHFVLRVPKKLFEPACAPLLCAGITTYSPMREFGIDKGGMSIAVVGLGGLGHMAVQFGKAFGQHVTVLSRSDKKKELAMSELKADDYVITKDEEAVKKCAQRFDAIIDTISAQHDLNQLLSMIKTDGKLIMLGATEQPLSISTFSILANRRTICGSLIGGIAETQEMLDFCAEHDVRPFVEVVPVDKVNECVDRMVDGDVKFRFVIDTLGSLIMDK